MKIVFTGGGTGGHFYPLIAVAEAVRSEARAERLIDPKLYYLATEKYDESLLFKLAMEYRHVPAGKMRRYFSLRNFIDPFITFVGFLKALGILYALYPDVIFAKGAYVSFPVLLAARVLKIPVVIHESDSAPGRVNIWAGKFAKAIGVAFPEAANFFPKDKVALVGLPVRKDLISPVTPQDVLALNLKDNLPLILIVGGSLGAALVNDAVVAILPKLVEKYQIIHQTGKNNFVELSSTAELVLSGNPKKENYKMYDYLSSSFMKAAAKNAVVIVSRAGSTIFEIALWGKPSILIPITDSNGDHQRKNAYSYSNESGAIVIEEKNLTPNVLFTEIDLVASNPDLQKTMSEKALAFARPDAAEKIARELVAIAHSHGS